MLQTSIDAELGHPDAQDMIASTATAHLAYTAHDGSPRVVPVGFCWTGTEFVVSTAATAPKVAALSTSPAVALAIDSGDTPGGARALLVRGVATVDIVDGVVPDYLAAARYVCPRRVGLGRPICARECASCRSQTSSTTGVRSRVA